MMRPLRHLFRLSLLVCCCLLLAACGAAKAPKSKPAAAKDTGVVNEGLVIKGATVDPKTGARDVPKLAAATTAGKGAATKDAAASNSVEALPEPELNADGSLVGTDPFADTTVQVAPTPIDGDPSITKELTGLGYTNDLDDPELNMVWRNWVRAGNTLGRTPDDEPQDLVPASLVSIAIEKCGGARQIAMGVVLGPEVVVTTLSAVDNAAKRIWVGPFQGTGPRQQGMLQYIDAADDIAVYRVPGLTAPSLATYAPEASTQTTAFAYGIRPGGRQGRPERIGVIVSTHEVNLTLEQYDGFGKHITDRDTYPFIGPVDSGYAGGVIVATNEDEDNLNLAFHGLIRSRVPYRADGGGVSIPSRIVNGAVSKALALDPWFEIRPGPCPNWYRPTH